MNDKSKHHAVIVVNRGERDEYVLSAAKKLTVSEVKKKVKQEVKTLDKIRIQASYL